jgi:hypothetical protein
LVRPFSPLPVLVTKDVGWEKGMERWSGGTEDGEEREGKRRMKRVENER